ncbi:hypothetical protein [Marinicauda pacifica]|uniref:hypothetical protein n=1 Tax=Marinicauda pacifica TaxID=1133559 RepID=UPI0035C7B24C
MSLHKRLERLEADTDANPGPRFVPLERREFIPDPPEPDTAYLIMGVPRTDCTYRRAYEAKTGEQS